MAILKSIGTMAAGALQGMSIYLLFRSIDETGWNSFTAGMATWAVALLLWQEGRA